MTLKILNEYIKDDKQITEYTRDGETISHTVVAQISEEVEVNEVIETTSIEEQILAETQYQTALIEMQTFGGM